MELFAGRVRTSATKITGELSRSWLELPMKELLCDQVDSPTRKKMARNAPIFSTMESKANATNLRDRHHKMASGGINAGYRFFEDKLQPSLGFSLNNNTSGSFTADFQVLLRGGLRWVITEKLSLNLSAMQNAYRYGSRQPNAHFTENTLQARLGWVFRAAR